MALPMLIYLVLWLRPVAGIPLAVLFGLSLWCAQRPRLVFDETPFERLVAGMRSLGRPLDQSEDGQALLTRKTVILVVVVALVWCVLGGQGGIWYQSFDWNGRNALFRDLLTHAWPVVYDFDGGAMCYYFAHWLPPALVGKLFYLAFEADLAWKLANFVLLAWTCLGVSLLLMMVTSMLKIRKTKHVLACLLALIFFSTPDALGLVLLGVQSGSMGHLEWWAGSAQFSSITSCLFYVFNQAVIPWMCTLIFLQERTPVRYLPLWACCLFAGPFPALGLALLMLAEGVRQLVVCSSRRPLLAAVVSPANLLALPSIVVTGLFLLSNTADPDRSWVEGSMIPYPFYFPSDAYAQRALFVFLLLEAVLVPALLLHLGGDRASLAYLVLVLLLCPFVRTSVACDFCMRVSLPIMFVLGLMCAQYLALVLQRAAARMACAPAWALAAVLCVGALTPLAEFSAGFRTVDERGIADSLREEYVSFEDYTDWPRSNYVVPPECQDGLYYTYLSA